jgi:hypothetical protein
VAASGCGTGSCDRALHAVAQAATGRQGRLARQFMRKRRRIRASPIGSIFLRTSTAATSAQSFQWMRRHRARLPRSVPTRLYCSPMTDLWHSTAAPGHTGKTCASCSRGDRRISGDDSYIGYCRSLPCRLVPDRLPRRRSPSRVVAPASSCDARRGRRLCRFQNGALDSRDTGATNRCANRP